MDIQDVIRQLRQEPVTREAAENAIATIERLQAALEKVSLQEQISEMPTDELEREAMALMAGPASPAAGPRPAPGRATGSR